MARPLAARVIVLALVIWTSSTHQAAHVTVSSSGDALLSRTEESSELQKEAGHHLHTRTRIVRADGDLPPVLQDARVGPSSPALQDARVRSSLEADSAVAIRDRGDLQRGALKAVVANSSWSITIAGDNRCPAVVPNHAQCKERDASGHIPENGTCTWECKDGSTEPQTSTCKCTVTECALEPSTVECTTACFPASSAILLTDGTEASLASLRPGDLVFGVDAAWGLAQDKYLADFHSGQAEQQSMHRFLEIRHACQPAKPLRITSNHLLYATDAASVRGNDNQISLTPAGNLRPGLDAVLALGCRTSNAGGLLTPSVVLNVTHVWAQGLYNPLTHSRTAIVDGVATSNLVLTSGALERAWNELPRTRALAAPLGWLITALPRVCATVGLPAGWVSHKGLQRRIVSGLDRLFQFISRWAA